MSETTRKVPRGTVATSLNDSEEDIQSTALKVRRNFDKNMYVLLLQAFSSVKVHKLQQGRQMAAFANVAMQLNNNRKIPWLVDAKNCADRFRMIMHQYKVYGEQYGSSEELSGLPGFSRMRASFFREMEEVQEQRNEKRVEEQEQEFFLILGGAETRERGMFRVSAIDMDSEN